MPRRVERISVVVADDHPLYRSAIIETVKEDVRLEFVGEAEDGRAALEAIREHRPDVVVLDMAMPELDGLAVLKAVTRDELKTRVIVVSADVDSQLVYDAIAAVTGASRSIAPRGTLLIYPSSTKDFEPLSQPPYQPEPL